MRLLVVMPTYWPAFQYGGPIFCIHDLNKSLVKKGIEVTVYTTNAGIEDKVEANTSTSIDGVNVYYFKVNKMFEYLGDTGWQFSLSLTKALKHNIKSYDLVYIVYVWNYTVAAAAYYARKHNIPYIISPIGTLYDETRSHNSWKKWPYFKLISQRDLNGASAIHYTTTDELDKCHKSLNLKNTGFIVPNGINLAEFESLPDKNRLKNIYPHLKNKDIILFLGRISWKKGLDILIPAFAELYKKNKNAHLLIVGNDEEGYSRELKEIIIKSGLKYCDLTEGENNSQSSNNASITFTGILTGEHRLAAFSGSDVFVLSSYSENFGMAVIEAMVCGLPIIISNKVGVYLDIKVNNAGLVIDNNIEDLSESLATILNNSQVRKKLSETGKNFVVQHYDISNVADSMIETFQDIINNITKQNTCMQTSLKSNQF